MRSPQSPAEVLGRVALVTFEHFDRTMNRTAAVEALGTVTGVDAGGLRIRDMRTNLEISVPVTWQSLLYADAVTYRLADGTTVERPVYAVRITHYDELPGHAQLNVPLGRPGTPPRAT